MSEKIKKPMFWAAILGAVKLITDAFGVNIIDDQQINAVADGIATLLTISGVIISHDQPSNSGE